MHACGVDVSMRMTSEITTKLGLLVPAPNTVIEPEFYAMAPTTVSIHSARIPVPALLARNLQAETERHIARGVKEAAQRLVIAKVKVIALGVTGASFIDGPGWDKKIIQDIESSTGIPATTASTSAVNALKALKVRKLAVGTPYPEDINKLLRVFLEGNGFEIVNFESLLVSSAHSIADIPQQRTLELGKTVNRPEAEAIFISCTNFRTIDIIEPLEEALGKPVITANQAAMWESLRKAKYNKAIFGFGKLLAAY